MPSEYYKKWRKEHPRVQIYLSREDYEWLKGVAKSRGIPVTKLVLEAIRRLRREYEDGFNKALDMFIDNPNMFYYRVVERARSRGFEDFEPALFTTPCAACGDPVIITHRDSEWARAKKLLSIAFKEWTHMDCKLE